MKKFLMSILAVVSISAYAEDYNVNMNLEDVKKVLPTLSCDEGSETIRMCRYLGAIEMKSFINACFDKTNEKEKELADKVFNNWVIFEEEALNKAVNGNNKLIKILEKETKKYFKSIPSYEVGIECSRIALVAEQIKPEYASDLVMRFMKKRDGEQFFNTENALKRKAQSLEWIENYGKEFKNGS